MSGQYTQGILPTLTADQIGAGAATILVGVDTQYANGQQPESAQVTLAQLQGTVPNATALTAFAGGGQASATVAGFGLSLVTTVATAADSVRLPANAPIGATVTLINTAAPTVPGRVTL